MAKDQNIPVRPDVLAADLEACAALEAIANYQPVNPAYAKERLAVKQAALLAAQKASTQAENALATARDNEVALGWDFHNSMLGVKEQVIAQFGSDSNELQSLGLKKKSERARPSARKGAAA